MEFVRADECVEVTPHSVRLRKVDLDKSARVKAARAASQRARAAAV
jgi:GTP-binding protein